MKGRRAHARAASTIFASTPSVPNRAARAARVGTVGVDAKKRRCRKLHQVCGKKKKCCGSKLKCDRITKSGCESVAGRRCCGRIGATCDNDADGNSHCDCCDGLFCSGASGLGTCTDTPT